MREPGARLGAGSPGGADYLIEYSTNPIVATGPSDYEIFPPSAVDSRFYTGPWYMDFTPDEASSDATIRYVWHQDTGSGAGGIYYLRKNNANTYRFRLAGVNYSLVLSHGAGVPLRFTFDPTGGEVRLEVIGGASVTQSIADADLATDDVAIGADTSGNFPFLGEIYQPIAGTP